jgi:hypothetical protein
VTSSSSNTAGSVHLQLPQLPQQGQQPVACSTADNPAATAAAAAAAAAAVADTSASLGLTGLLSIGWAMLGEILATTAAAAADDHNHPPQHQQRQPQQPYTPAQLPTDGLSPWPRGFAFVPAGAAAIGYPAIPTAELLPLPAHLLPPTRSSLDQGAAWQRPQQRSSTATCMMQRLPCGTCGTCCLAPVTACSTYWT